MEPTLNDIREAAGRIKPFIHRTPILTCQALDAQAGAKLFFKCENFQKGGAFKIRGATNAVFTLTNEEAARGVATHSSGNHAAALALAARWRGIKARVVMPENAPAVKQAAVRSYGADITYCAPTLQAREETLATVLAQTGAAFIPPYNDYRVIAGQGTAALELMEEIGDLDVVIAPVGGGGLLSGTAITVTAAAMNARLEVGTVGPLTPSLSPSEGERVPAGRVRGASALNMPHANADLRNHLCKCRVLGAEPAMADDAWRSLQAGAIVPAINPVTVADGLRTSLGDLTFPIIRRHVAEIFTVSEAGIVDAMRLIWERMKIVVEPSAAVPLAAILAQPQEFAGRKVGVILSGGNADLERLPWLA